MNRLLILFCIVTVVGMNLLTSCSKDSTTDPPKAGIFSSVVGKQAAFTALTLRTSSWSWDFGDGTTSNEKDPVHVYKDGGVYTVKLVATGSDNQTAEATTEVTLALSLTEMLTGGAKAPNGKRWKISTAHPKDGFALADDNFSVIQPIGAGMLGNPLGLTKVYDDEFIFKADGSYTHAVKSGGAFAGLVYTILNGLQPIQLTAMSQSFGLCYAAFTPQTGATYTFTEKKDLAVTTVNAAGTVPTDRVYSGVMTLNFSGKEFIGFMDFMRECIVQEITPTSMRLAMFVCTSQKAYYNKPTHVVILTFENIK